MCQVENNNFSDILQNLNKNGRINANVYVKIVSDKVSHWNDS